MLRLAILEMHQRRGRVFRKIRKARFHDRPLLAFDGPGGALTLLVNHALDRLGLLGGGVLESPGDDPLLVNGKLHEESGRGSRLFTILSDGKHTQRHPLGRLVDMFFDMQKAIEIYLLYEDAHDAYKAAVAAYEAVGAEGNLLAASDEFERLIAELADLARRAGVF